MEETLRWWWTYYASKKEIEKMKKNMKKLPVIQKKAEIYHKEQVNEAEKFINNAFEDDNIETTKNLIIDNVYKYQYIIWLRNKLIYRIKNLLFKKSNGN